MVKVDPLFGALAVQPDVLFINLSQILPEGVKRVGLRGRLLLGRGLHTRAHGRLRLLCWWIGHCIQTIVDCCEVHYLVFIPSEEEEGDSKTMQIVTIIDQILQYVNTTFSPSVQDFFRSVRMNNRKEVRTG